MTLKRYAICGLSNRAVHEYALPLIGSPDADDDYSAFGRLVGIVDVDRVRCERFLSRTSTEIPLYAPDDFARMVQEQQPDQNKADAPRPARDGGFLRRQT